MLSSSRNIEIRVMSSKYSSSMDKIYGSFKTDTSSSSNETSSSIIHAALNELSKSQKKKQIRVIIKSGRY